LKKGLLIVFFSIKKRIIVMKSLVYFGVVFAFLGLLLLVFKKGIGTIYDKMDLTDREKSHYKNLVVPLCGIVFIISSFICLGAYFTSGDIRENFVCFVENNKSVFYLILGLVFSCIGVLTFFIRIFGRESKLFIKYDIMKRQSGSVGILIHVLKYTLLPLFLGTYFLLKYFRVIP